VVYSASNAATDNGLCIIKYVKRDYKNNGGNGISDHKDGVKIY